MFSSKLPLIWKRICFMTDTNLKLVKWLITQDTKMKKKEKKEKTLRAKANTFPHFLPNVLGNLKWTTQWFEVDSVLPSPPSRGLMATADSKSVWNIGFLPRISEAAPRFSSRMEPIKASLTLCCLGLSRYCTSLLVAVNKKQMWNICVWNSVTPKDRG